MRTFPRLLLFCCCSFIAGYFAATLRPHFVMEMPDHPFFVETKSECPETKPPPPCNCSSAAPTEPKEPLSPSLPIVTPAQITQDKSFLPISMDWQAVAQIPRNDFVHAFDNGNPTDEARYAGLPDVLLLYRSPEAMPSKSHRNEQPARLLAASNATRNCDELRVVQYPLDSSRPTKRQCLALLPGLVSPYVSRWARIDPTQENAKLDPTKPLDMIPRNYDIANGIKIPSPPNEGVANDHLKWLAGYLHHLPSMLEELRPIVMGMLTPQKSLVVMSANAAERDSLLNFACAARARGLSLKHVLVFCMDSPTHELVQSLGMMAYSNADIFPDMPTDAPKSFGDATYRKIAVAKFVYPHVMSLLGVDFLQQDVDILWYKDPLQFFQNTTLAPPKWDIFFQDDINSQPRFAPIRGNGGFFFVRNNPRTRAAMKDFVMSTDMMAASGSHQVTLLARLMDHVSLMGLKVKTYDAWMNEYFPGGGTYHLDKSYMEDLLRYKRKKPYIFHMSWTYTKALKQLQYEQMGEWYVQESCLDTATSSSTLDGLNCCLSQPIFRCHFRDKPSLKPCHDSPTYNGKDDAKSWWND